MATNALSSSASKSSRRALILAVAFGALAAVLVAAYLQSAGGGSKTASAASVPVVFAKVDIPERTKIKEGMIEVRQLPVDVRHPLAIREQNAAVDQITRVKIAAGEQILSAKLADQVRDVGFSGAIPDGKRAVAIGVSEVIASGGHVSPGDYVDVIGVFELFVPTDKDGKAIGQGNQAYAGSGQSDKIKPFTAMTILQHVQVLAVARNADTTLDSSADKDSKKSSASSRDEAKSVTLAVTAEQAEKVFLAEELGKLRLSLRPFGDDDQRSIPALSNTIGELAGQ